MMTICHFKQVGRLGVSALLVMLMACSSADDVQSMDADVQSMDALKQGNQQNLSDAIAPATASVNEKKAKIYIDWTKVDSGIKPINPDEYHYPFAVDSQPVQKYASAYHINPKQAQKSMVLAMASPEALTKVLEQIEGHYLGHSLVDGAEMSLVIYTSHMVIPTQFNYVIADNFGKGLVLPIQVVPYVLGQQAPQVDMTNRQYSHLEVFQ